MDELAETLGVDPIELRLRNDTQIEPELNKPFSSRHLAECLREGASASAGETRREACERSRRAVARRHGVASAIRGDLLKHASARARLESDGRLIVELAMTDIGTGSYTILTQVAAETMELPVDRVTVRLGDTNFPPTDGSGGSWGAATSGAAVLAACRKLKAALPSGSGKRRDRSPRPSWTTATPMTPSARISRKSAWIGIPARSACGACSACFAPPHSQCQDARSQMIGGMIWGIGAALMEGNHVDLALRLVHQPDLASYHVAVNAMLAQSTPCFSRRPTRMQPARQQGLGELGICGAGAAIINAIHNATGARIREFPATLDKLLPTLEALED